MKFSSTTENFVCKGSWVVLKLLTLLLFQIDKTGQIDHFHMDHTAQTRRFHVYLQFERSTSEMLCTAKVVLLSCCAHSVDFSQ